MVAPRVAALKRLLLAISTLSLFPCASALPQGSLSGDEPDGGAAIRYPADLAKQRIEAPAAVDQSKAQAQQNKEKIINGKDAPPGKFPWQVAVLLRSEASEGDPFLGAYCGGTLIGWRWVLTAAHCTYKSGPPLTALKETEIAVYIGSTNFESGHRRKVKRIVPHPKYDSKSQDNDLALFELTEEPPRTDLSLAPRIGDDDATATKPDGPATVVGWGSTVQGSLDPKLREMVRKLQYIDDVIFQHPNPCNLEHIKGARDLWRERLSRSGQSEDAIKQTLDAWYPREKVLITDNMLCAGSTVRAQDSCFGDSGGPLLILKGKQYLQVGIVSWGPREGCAMAAEYGVYTRLSRYEKWIQEIIK